VGRNKIVMGGPKVPFTNGLEMVVAAVIILPPRPLRIESPNNVRAVSPDMIEDDTVLNLWVMKQILSCLINLEKRLATSYTTIYNICSHL
jgi:hypothetical protein